MEWLELIVHTTTEAADAVSEALIGCGATGTMVEDRADIPDPSKPNGYWEIIDPALITQMPEDVLVHAWLAPDDTLQENLKLLRERLDALAEIWGEAAGSLRVDTANVKDEDWSEVWKQFYKPFRAGERLVVKPTWEAYTPREGDLIIEIDPGMAFGSGMHETTSMCLQLLEQYVRKGCTVFDVGTGSGILAIGAALLGARDVLAIDIDENAVRVAKENIAHNGLADRIRAEAGNLLDRAPDALCDVCVANIIADVICGFAEPLVPHIRPGGVFLCSGIIAEREGDVLRALRGAGYDVKQVLRKGEWVAIAAGRPD